MSIPSFAKIRHVEACRSAKNHKTNHAIINCRHDAEAVIRRCSVKKGILKNFKKYTGKHLCQSLFFNKKETLAQMFSCELCEIFSNAYFHV